MGKEDELDTLLSTLSKLETENLDLSQDVQERDGEISKMSSQISDLMLTNEELCRTKVKLEIRAVELEEQKDRWEDEKKELDQNIEQLKTEMKVRLEAFGDVEKERDILKKDIEHLHETQSEYNLNQKYNDQEMVEKAEKIKEQAISLAEMEKLLQGKASEIGNMLTALDSKQVELNTATDHLNVLRSENIQTNE